MKLTIPRATLVAAITTAPSFARGSTLPILSNVLLKADAGHVELTSPTKPPNLMALGETALVFAPAQVGLPQAH